MKILVTGCAGFIGFHLCKSLLDKKIQVYGVDNLNNYYSVKLKKMRLSILQGYKKFTFSKIDISKYKKLERIFEKNKFSLIINLAAQAGVRYSIINPREYMESNTLGFFNILELSRKYKIKKIFYASSSSVYGDQKKFPVKENLKLFPKNIYSLSKKNNEELADIYFRYYRLKSLGLRFFTVYGEWGRPDMLMIKYILSKLKQKTFVLNHRGNHYRDFTYIKDVIKILNKLIFSKMQKGHDVINICSNNPFKVNKILEFIDKNYGRPKVKYQKKLNIEVLKTHGSNSKVKKITKFKNFTSLEKGLTNLIIWAKKYIKKI